MCKSEKSRGALLAHLNVVQLCSFFCLEGKISGPVGQHSRMVSTVASGPICLGFNLQRSKKNSEATIELLRLINGAAYRKVDSGLKMFMKPSSAG